MVCYFVPKGPEFSKQPDPRKELNVPEHEFPFLIHLGWTICVALLYAFLLYSKFEAHAFYITITVTMIAVYLIEVGKFDPTQITMVGMPLLMMLFTIWWSFPDEVLDGMFRFDPHSAVPFDYQHILVVGVTGAIVTWIVTFLFYRVTQWTYSKEDATIMALQTFVYYLIFTLMPQFVH